MEISLRMWLLGIEQHSGQIKLFKRKQNDCEVKRCSKFCRGEVLRLSLNVMLNKMYSLDSLSGGHIFITSCTCEGGLYGHRGLLQARLLKQESGIPFTALHVRTLWTQWCWDKFSSMFCLPLIPEMFHVHSSVIKDVETCPFRGRSGMFSDHQQNKEEDIRICNFCLWSQLALRSFDSKKSDHF